MGGADWLTLDDAVEPGTVVATKTSGRLESHAELSLKENSASYRRRIGGFGCARANVLEAGKPPIWTKFMKGPRIFCRLERALKSGVTEELVMIEIQKGRCSHRI